MTALMASAFAAVVAARLRSLPAAVAVSLAIGVALQGNDERRER
jgi:branched-chain amino acid transport system permease protein